MNRLREEVAFDPVSERGIELLRAVQPPPPQPELKRRVWVAMQQSGAGAPARVRPGVLRLAVLGAGVMVFAATAAAAIGGRWIVRQVEHFRAAPPAPEVAPVVVRHDHVHPARALAEAPPPAAEPPAAPALRELDRPRPHRMAVAPVTNERTQVLDALIALRRDHDARRASALLDAYLAGNRHGALREEALVLALEAADARQDVVRSVRLAQTYRDEFPNGRFTGFAQSHLRN